MAEKFGLGSEVRELKIGQSFTNPKSTAFHTLKYDFKPASVDTSKKATVDVAGNNQVTVTVPHLDGAGVPQTVFKGSQRPYQKECVIIIDRVTGEITLEKLNCNIQVKKTRSEYNRLHLSHDRLSNQSPASGSDHRGNASNRSQTPPAATTAASGRVSSKTRVASGRRPAGDRPPANSHHLIPKHSPLRASPGHPSPGGPHQQHRSPRGEASTHLPMLTSTQSSLNNEPHSQSTLASLPMIGIDDFTDPLPVPSQSYHNSSSYNASQSNSATEKPAYPWDNENDVGTISDSSTSSSDSDSDSEDATLTNSGLTSNKTTNGYSNGGQVKIDTHLLNDDLCLSESGSDSD